MHSENDEMKPAEVFQTHSKKFSDKSKLYSFHQKNNSSTKRETLQFSKRDKSETDHLGQAKPSEFL